MQQLKAEHNISILKRAVNEEAAAVYPEAKINPD